MKDRKLGILVLIFYFIYSYILIYVPLEIFSFDIRKFSVIEKTLYLLIFDLVFILILYFVYRKDLKTDLVDFKANYRSYLDTGFKYWVIALIVMGASNYIIQSFILDGIAANEETVRSMLKDYPIYMMFGTCLYAPFVEELIFRKSIKKIIGFNYGFIFVSALLFGSLHVITSLTSPLDLLYIIPYSSIGFALAFLYYKTKNIWSTITMHFIHNTLFITLQLIVLFL